jgi:hypothetical protein
MDVPLLTNRGRILVAGTALTLTLCTGCPEEEGWTWVDPAESAPYGQTFGDWIEDSWQLILGSPADTNPLFGGDCTEGQAGDVWFLAGSYGGEEVRDCTIPQGKAIHFPVRNVIGFACPEAFGPGDCAWADAEGVVALEADWPDGPAPAMWVEVDGEPLEDIESYLAHSEAFEMDYVEGANGIFYVGDFDFDCGVPWEDGNECGVDADSPKVAASAGYYPMAAPPPAGTYELHFRTENDDASWVLDITYNLTVE